MQNALSDIFEGLNRWHLWKALALDSFRSRYHRTLMGPIWITLTFLAFVSVKIFIFSEMARTNLDFYVAHLVLGFAVWNFLTSEISGGSTAFLTSRNWILGVKMPYSLFIYETTMTSLVNFFFSAVAALLITVWYFKLTLIGLLQAGLGLLFITFSLFWVKYVLAMLCVFFRDFVQFIATGMRIAFFLTPIIWVETTLGPKAKLVEYNPFYHYLNLIRTPLRDGVVAYNSWIVIAVITVVSIFTTIVFYQLSARKIPSHI